MCGKFHEWPPVMSCSQNYIKLPAAYGYKIYMKHEGILLRLGFHPQDTSSHCIYLQMIKFYILYLCAHMHREVTGQLKRIGSLLPPCESGSSNSIIRLGTRLLCLVSHPNAFKILEWVTLWTLSIWDMIYHRMKFKGDEWKKKHIKQSPETRSKNYEPQLCIQDGQQNF